MDLKRLRCFAMVAETLHFTRAAERLHMAQPALSVQIQSLEKELGVALFERDRRRVELTIVGAMFLAEARDILAGEERALRVLEQARRGQIGRIEVGYVGSVAYSGVLAHSVRSLGRVAPDIELSIHELELEAQIEQILDGRIDIGFLRLPAGPDAQHLAIRPVLEEDVMVALPAGHPLCAAEIVDPADLAGQPLLGTNLREGLGFFDTILGICRDAGFEPRIVTRARHFATIMNLVAVGRGVALMPAPVSRLGLPGVEYRLLRSARRSPVAVAYRAEHAAPALLRYLPLCIEAGRALGTPGTT